MNTSSSPRLVQNTILSSMPSPASIDQVAQNSSLPPLVAAPDSGIICQSPANRIERQVPGIHRFSSMKN